MQVYEESIKIFHDYHGFQASMYAEIYNCRHVFKFFVSTQLLSKVHVFMIINCHIQESKHLPLVELSSDSSISNSRSKLPYLPVKQFN